MEHIMVNEKIRIETVKLSMANEIFSTIDRDRQYLKKWLPFIESSKQISDTVKFLHSIVNQPHDNRNEIYSIYYKEEFAGLIGFKETDWINKKTELGYWLAKKMQGKGIITSCVLKLIKFAFQKLKMNRIQIKVAVGNLKSSAIPKRLNFKFEGIERAGEKHGNDFFDIEIYSLLRSDFQ